MTGWRVDQFAVELMSLGRAVGGEEQEDEVEVEEDEGVIGG